ncbi:hypothetical protein R75461_05291 [Paraburkholderia nemoris]|uniref:hypothetical protein n=1 Tax=Paraburkholderia nemoris TaxID=2793076 RepID=UPI00190B0DC7|nr:MULTISPECIES: hypothetical protein [Paraburkholderia]MBK3783947.1 hypothetical protein [Paraburkholderia aspalathi]CAE6803262.1 hypothetical protein R75461_05291 [Paraburkholderia nemoris]
MSTAEEQRAEEQQAIARERQTFDRRQKAFINVTRQFAPHGNGSPSQDDLDELDAADAEWQAATAEMDRISEEIRTGKRR